MARRNNDKYANILSAEVTVAAGDTAFTEVNLGVSLGQGMGVLIDQIDYDVSVGALDDMQTDSDTLQLAWTTTNADDSLTITKKHVIDQFNLTYLGIGTPGNGEFIEKPWVRKFDPPIIVAAPKIYLAVATGGVTAGGCYSRIYYRFIDLSAQEYLEIAESFILVG